MDEFDEELEHLMFMDECRELVKKIVAAWSDRPLQSLKNEWYDIHIFGDEPIFTSLLFDKLEAEDAPN